MSVWFSASFVVPALRAEWSLSSAGASLLTIAVQIGFVVGALTNAATGLADTVRPRVMMAVGSWAAAAANALMLLAPGIEVAVVARLATGFFLASVYPSALKEISTWFKTGRGTALGIIIGALTLGSALPHLVNVFGDLDWRLVIAATSVLTATGGAIVLGLRGTGPYPFPRRPFNVGAALASLRTRDVVLANVGYVGHMWELYAMWAWVGVFLAGLPGIASSGNPQSTASLLAFACIATGALGCLVGGVISDRRGRAFSAFLALCCSGGTAAVLAVSYELLPATAVVALCLFWGFWVIADSAQFSALVSERAPGEYVGGALALQLAIGFSTTVLTLWLVPTLAEAFSWHWALAVLAVGPAFGALAMLRMMRDDRIVG